MLFEYLLLWREGGLRSPLLVLFNCASILVLTRIFGPSLSNQTLKMGRKLNNVKVWKNHSSLKYFLCLEPFQFSSVAQSCPTLCDPMDCSTPGLPVHHQLPEFTQTHAHWVGDAIQPSHLSSASPPALNLGGFYKNINQNFEVNNSTIYFRNIHWEPMCSWLSPYKEINWKWLTDLNIRHDSIKLLGENIDKNILWHQSYHWFLRLKTIWISTETNKWDLIRLTSFCTAKEPTTTWKHNLQNGRKYLRMMQLTRA